MDKRLEDAFDIVKYQQTLINQRDLLKQWVTTRLHYAENGGLFAITPELISMVSILISDNRPSIVLLDNNNTPILIKNPIQFLNNIKELYFEITNQYYAEYQKLCEKRNVKDLVECNEEL